MADRSQNPDSLSSRVYQDLVQLTFLCGRGIPIATVLRRVLDGMRPDIPAEALWFHARGACLARSPDGAHDLPALPAPPATAVPLELPDGLLAAFVAPGVTLSCRPEAGYRERAGDVLVLGARLVALMWRIDEAEAEARPEVPYRAARARFERRWLAHVLAVHDGNVSAAARAAGVSRVHLYDMMKRHGVGAAAQDRDV